MRLDSNWGEILDQIFEKPYFQDINQTLEREIEEGNTIYPPLSLVFNAFTLTPFDDVRVVILGQDPYHGEGQAHGLSFSVPDNIKCPPSLKNIYKEISSDLGIDTSNRNGNLTQWSRQGVFLLNSILTVRAGQPASHSKIGWEKFTDEVISLISEKKEGVIFLLWGGFAKNKRVLIDESKHYILEAPHPSPLARGGFFGCKHFSKTNEILNKKGSSPISW